MKKLSKKFLAGLMAAALMLSLSSMAFAADDVTVQAILNKTTINTSDQAQEVTLNVKTSEPLVMGVYQGTLVLPEGWVMKNVESSDSRFTIGKDDWNPASGIFLFVTDDSENIENVSDYAKITIEIPANTKAGEYTIGIDNFFVGRDYGTVYSLKATATTTKLTIQDGDAVASTGAEITGADTVGLNVTEQLGVKLLPAGTTETVASTTWDSSEKTVATVSDTGLVTGLAYGKTTITANVTTSANKTYAVTKEITVSKSPYTVTAVRNGEGVVHAGDVVTMDVKVTGDKYASTQVIMSYDANLFEYVDCTSSDVTVKTGTGTVTVQRVITANTYADGDVFAGLRFKAKDVTKTETGTFGFTSATVTNTGEEVWKNATYEAAKESADVTITKQYKVTFLKEDGSELQSYTVDDKSKLTEVPEAPAKDYHHFDKWYVGETGYTAEEIKNAEVTADVTYKAAYLPNTYNVTLPEDGSLIGADKATYGEDYTVTVKDPETEDYDYKVSYEVDGEKKTTTVDKDGKATIPGADITGDMSLSLIQEIKHVTVNVYKDYVTGYSLVTVTGTATGYTYNGNAMFLDKQYDTTTENAADGNVHAWIVEGDVTVEAAKAVIRSAKTAGTEIAKSNNVNNLGDVNFLDAVCVYTCYTFPGGVNNNMAGYLRADVNGDHVVDATDMNQVLEA